MNAAAHTAKNAETTPAAENGHAKGVGLTESTPLMTGSGQVMKSGSTC